MTREEFYLRSVLAMAANPKYVEMEVADDDPDIRFPALQIETLLIDAEALLRNTEKEWGGAFDDTPVSKTLSEMSDSLRGLDEQGITAYCTIEER